METEMTAPIRSRQLRPGMLIACVALMASLASVVQAADSENGKRLAGLRCAPCHVVRPHQREEVADSLPFAIIARRFGSNPDTLALAMRDPHPRMNIALTRREAEDLAAYVVPLGK
jgi:hypothetical protein